MIEKIDISKLKDFPDNRIDENRVFAEKINEIIEYLNRPIEIKENRVNHGPSGNYPYPTGQ